MRLTGRDLDGIPPRNLRVPLVEFAQFWVDAERAHDDRVARKVPDWYGAGVVAACRWLARSGGQMPDGRGYVERSPITRKQTMAMPELIEAEYLAAVQLVSRQPAPAWLLNQPGWAVAVEHTLAWAWKRLADTPPLDQRHASTG